MPTDALRDSRDSFFRRHPVAAVEYPDFPQYARGDIEMTIAEFVQRAGKIQEVGRFRREVSIANPAVCCRQVL